VDELAHERLGDHAARAATADAAHDVLDRRGCLEQEAQELVETALVLGVDAATVDRLVEELDLAEAHAVVDGSHRNEELQAEHGDVEVVLGMRGCLAGAAATEGIHRACIDNRSIGLENDRIG
jgi:hypothetical protein